jgi:two-component system LytT family response regulator
VSGRVVRVAVVDDEAIARERLCRLLAREPNLEVVAVCASGSEAVAAITELRPEIAFLDIRMPGMDGFGVIRALRATEDAAGDASLPLFVFVTAFDDHAVHAFDVHAVDYVLKPIDPARLGEAVERARTRLGREGLQRRHAELVRRLTGLIAEVEAGIVAPPATVEPAEAAGRAERLLVRAGERLFFIRAEEIDWIEAAGNYARLHVGAKTHLVRETMTRLAERLDPSRFLRIHRSTIVNVERVREMQPWGSGEYVVFLQDGTQLRLSRWYRERVLATLPRLVR